MSTTRAMMIAVGMAVGAVACTTYKDPRDIALSQRFVTTGEGTVRDDVTDLTWAANANLPGFRSAWDGYSWHEALEYVSAMNAGFHPNFGRTDWRLPRVEELAALLAAFHRPANAAERRSRAFWDWIGSPTPEGILSDVHRIPANVFVNVQEDAYWSGTAAVLAGKSYRFGPYFPSGSNNDVDPKGPAWVVDTNGAAYVLDKGSRKRLWPVCGGPQS